MDGNHDTYSPSVTVAISMGSDVAAIGAVTRL